MSSVFFNKGENCIAAGRLFVAESIHDEYVERIVSLSMLNFFGYSKPEPVPSPLIPHTQSLSWSFWLISMIFITNKGHLNLVLKDFWVFSNHFHHLGYHILIHYLGYLDPFLRYLLQIKAIWSWLLSTFGSLATISITLDTTLIVDWRDKENEDRRSTRPIHRPWTSEPQVCPQFFWSFQ